MKHLFLAAFLFATLSCDTSEPPSGGEPSVQFAAVDASCTEVWLQVKMHANVQPRTIRIRRDTLTILNTALVGTDTVVIDEDLLPNHQYSYTLTAGFNERVISRAATLAPTPHMISWSIDSLGDGGGSALNDVTIIDDTLVYAVGEMYLRDSLGQLDLTAYNVAQWNRETWRLLRVQFLDFCGQPSTYSYPDRAVFAFGGNSVWITSGSQYVVWNGDYQTTPRCIAVSVNQLWRANSNSIYAVGYGGAIAQYNGSTWSSEEPPEFPGPPSSPVSLDDVSGSSDGTKVWSCGFRSNDPGTYLLRRRSDATWELAYDGTAAEFSERNDSLSGTYTSLYMPGEQVLLVATSAGVYRAPIWTRGEAQRISGRFPGFPLRLRGTGPNNIFCVGSRGMVAHYNGLTWNVYTELAFPNTEYRSVSVKGNKVLIVGYRGNRAIAIRGTW